MNESWCAWFQHMNELWHMQTSHVRIWMNHIPIWMSVICYRHANSRVTCNWTWPLLQVCATPTFLDTPATLMHIQHYCTHIPLYSLLYDLHYYTTHHISTWPTLLHDPTRHDMCITMYYLLLLHYYTTQPVTTCVLLLTTYYCYITARAAQSRHVHYYWHAQTRITTNIFITTYYWRMLQYNSTHPVTECVIPCIHMCAMTHSHVWHNALTCVTQRTHLKDTTHPVTTATQDDACDMAQLYVWHNSQMHVTRLIHICDTTHSYFWHLDSYLWHLHVQIWLVCACDTTL